MDSRIYDSVERRNGGSEARRKHSSEEPEFPGLFCFPLADCVGPLLYSPDPKEKKVTGWHKRRAPKPITAEQ